MAWESLKNRIDKGLLPLVLAGPMLRKVTPTSVTVWFALLKKSTVNLTVLDDKNTPMLKGERETIDVGKNLHIVAATAVPIKPGDKLTENVIYRYDVEFMVEGESAPQSLKKATTKEKEEAILGYPHGSLPSFALPPDKLDNVRIMLGSCRKPNGEGPDALEILENLIEKSALLPLRRPHQLLLTGDQIYADEVADVLLLMLTDAGITLLGEEEKMPKIKEEDKLLPTTRSKHILNTAGFTTVDHRSHLMTFGEYLAMYLFVWSDVLWSKDFELPTYDQLKEIVGKGKLATLKKDILKQINMVTLFANGLKKARRALANVPTYMIFDDHEITDDWNSTLQFCDAVYGSVLEPRPLGLRIVQNGLAAYVLCQHWGNVPEQFLDEPKAAGFHFLEKFKEASEKGGGYNTLVDDMDFQRYLGVHTGDFLYRHEPPTLHHEPDSIIYNYTIEEKQYQIIVTDSRTWRSFPKGQLGPGNIIAESQLKSQILNTPELINRMLLIVVSTNMPPTPTIRQGSRDTPDISKDAVINLKKTEEEFVYLDFYDSWEVERADFGKAITEISKKFPTNATVAHMDSVILLSGDVHFSFASRCSFSANPRIGVPSDTTYPARIVFAQLVSSSLHNEEYKTLGVHIAGYPYVPPQYITTKPIKLFNVSEILKQSVVFEEDFVGWNPSIMRDGEIIGRIKGENIIPFTSNVGFNRDRPNHTTRLEEFSRGPFQGSYTQKFDLTSDSPPPNYRFHLQYLKPIFRSKESPRPPNYHSNEALENWYRFSITHGQYVRKVSEGGQIVGKNNLGQLQFVGKRMAMYTVWWLEEGNLIWSRYDVPLEREPYDPQ